MDDREVIHLLFIITERKYNMESLDFSVEDIPTGILSTSLVGIQGTYPRGRGNYTTTGSATIVYVIVNVSGEDLKDAIRQQDIGKTMKAVVYQTAESAVKVAFVTDERLPVKARSFRCWRHVPDNIAVHILRTLYNTPDRVCICEDPLSETDACEIHRGQRGENGKWSWTGRCRGCYRIFTYISK